MYGSMPEDPHYTRRDKRPHPNDTQRPNKRSRESSYQPAQAAQAPTAYPLHNTTEFTCPPDTSRMLEAPLQETTDTPRSLSADEMRNRHILQPKSLRGHDVRAVARPHVTQTCDNDNTSLSTPPQTLANISQDYSPSPNAISSALSSPSRIAQHMVEGATRHRPVTPSTSQGQQAVKDNTRKRVHNSNHGTADPGPLDQAYQMQPHHDTRTVINGSLENPRQKGAPKNSPEKSFERGYISLQPALIQAEQPVTPGTHRSSDHGTQFSELRQLQNGNMKHPQYAQSPQQVQHIQQPQMQQLYAHRTLPHEHTQYVQQPRQVHYPQQSASVTNMAAVGADLPVQERWLQCSLEDLMGRAITEIPGIPPQHVVHWLREPTPVLIPGDVWSLRSLSAKGRYDAYCHIVSTGRYLLHMPADHPQHQHVWTVLMAISERLVHLERDWYTYNRQGNWAPPRLRSQEMRRIIQLQTQGKTVDPAYTQTIHVHAPDMVQYQTVSAPATQPPIAPPSQQSQGEPEFVYIPSRSSSPSLSVKQDQPKGDTALLQSDQESPHPVLNVNGKRQAEAEPEPEGNEDTEDAFTEAILQGLGLDKSESEGEPEDNDGNGFEEAMTHTFEETNAEEERKKKEKNRKKRVEQDNADELFYEQNSEKVDRVYLGLAEGTHAGDGNRKRSDPWYKKMFVYNEHREKIMGPKTTKKKKKSAASKPSPALQKPRAKRQKTK